MKRILNLQLGFSVAALTFTLLFLLGCGNNVEQSESIRPVFYQKISTSNGTNQFTIPGVVQYDKEAKMSFKVGGVINLIHAKVGQKVTKGTVLATLDAVDYTLSLSQAKASNDAVEANVQKAQAQLTNSKSNYLRIERLYKNNNASLSEFEKAKAQYDNAKSGLKASESQAEASIAKVLAAQNQLNYTRLTAPISGTISQIFMEENEMIAAGAPAILLASDNAFEVKTTVPENWINHLEVGQDVAIIIASINQNFTGTIKEITPGTKANTGYPIKVSIDQKVDEIRSGMSVKVHIPNLINSDSLQVLTVDVDAVSNDADGFFIYVLTENEEGTYTANRRTVEVEKLSKDGYIITKGLQNDELIATAGIRFLYDGKIVKLKEAELQ